MDRIEIWPVGLTRNELKELKKIAMKKAREYNQQGTLNSQPSKNIPKPLKYNSVG